METVETEIFKHTIVHLPSGRYCVSTRHHWLAKLRTFKIITVSLLYASLLNDASLPSHLNSKLKQTAYSVKSSPQSIEHPVRVSTAWQSVRHPHQRPYGRKSYNLPSRMIPCSEEVMREQNCSYSVQVVAIRDFEQRRLRGRLWRSRKKWSNLSMCKFVSTLSAVIDRMPTWKDPTLLEGSNSGELD